MPGTLISTTRQPVLLSGVTRYQVAATCVAQGTLPDVYVFVRQIVQFDDPKDDVFYRLSAPADFTEIGTDREAAIVRGATPEGAYLYRATSFAKDYATAQEALGAWQELSAQLNTLVNDYDTFTTAFLTAAEGALVSFPAADESMKTQAITAYEESLAAVTAAEELRDAENAACEVLRGELLAAQERLLDATADATALGPVIATLAPLGGTVNTLRTSSQVSVDAAASTAAASTASSGDKSVISGQLTNATNQNTALGGVATTLDTFVYAPLSTLHATLQARVSTAQAEVLDLQRDVNACGLEMATLQGAVDAARSQRDAALSLVRTICPDYVA